MVKREPAFRAATRRGGLAGGCLDRIAVFLYDLICVDKGEGLDGLCSVMEFDWRVRLEYVSAFRFHAGDGFKVKTWGCHCV